MLTNILPQDTEREDHDISCTNISIIGAPSALVGTITGVTVGVTTACPLPAAVGTGVATGFGVLCLGMITGSFFSNHDCHYAIDDEETPYMRMSS